MHCLDLPPNERTAWLQQACRGDAVLRADVESLLRESEHGEAPHPPPVIPGYEIVRELGRGGMGVVYEAYETALQRRVAIKCLHGDERISSAQRIRFRNEPRAAARLDHPNIVRIHASGETESVQWFAMELVRGHDLRAEIERQRAEGTPDAAPLLPHRGSTDYVLAVLRTVRDIATALHYAHEAGVVHRDVKPHNILLREEDGRALMADFGVAKDSRMGTITSTGHAPGTVFYMSPEQIAVWRQGVDRRTDVYSLGVVLYELLTLQRPFEGDTEQQVLAAIVAGRPRPLRAVDPSLSRDLELVCNRAMEKELADRYATARQFADDLNCLLSLASPLHARPAGWVQRLRRAVSRNSGVIWVLFGMSLAAFGSGWLVTARGHAAERERLHLRLDEAATIELDSADFAERAEFAGALRAADAATADPAISPSLERLRAELRRFRADRLERAAAWLAGTTELSPYDPTVALDLLSAQNAVAAVLQLVPTDASARALSADIERAGFGAVSITLRTGPTPAVGKVSAREILPTASTFGPRIELGSLPLASSRLRPGHYRFDLDVEGRPRAEVTRMVLPGRSERIDVVQRPEPATDAGMVRIEGGTLKIPDRADDACCHRGREVEVATFLLDEAEVSVGDYEEFVLATGHRTPPREVWEAMRRDPGLRDRPVVLVAYADAQTYAEWRGKRLPTHAEWEWAARGESLRPFPWTADAGAEYRGATRGRPSGSRPEQRIADWMAWTMPVRSGDDRAVGHGAYHLLGNVCEWTESVHVEGVEEGGPDGGAMRWVPDPRSRWVLGAAWDAERRGETLEAHEIAAITAAGASWRCGFRCARSLP